MRPEDIKAELADLGYNLSIIADALGKSPSLVSKVVRSKARSQVVAEAIAKILNRPVDVLFPGQYDWVGKSKISEYDRRVRELRALLMEEKKV